MLYVLLKIIVRIALKVFYKRLHIHYEGEIPTNVPLLVISNHPNTFMDPYLIAAHIRPEVFFLAKGEVFSSGFKRWLFSKMNMIPIYRQTDAKEGEKVDNEAIFRKCFDFLEENGTILIFPEGTSINERRLRKIKTGAARIVLGAEERHNFGLNVHILPIGLNYSDATSFRSKVTVNIGKAFHAASYQEEYRQNPIQAVQKLTDTIKEQIERLIVVAETPEDDYMIRQIERIFKYRLIRDFAQHQKVDTHFVLSKGIADAFHYFKQKNPAKVKEISQKITQYEHNLHRLRLKDEWVGRKKGKNLFVDSVFTAFYTLLGFPIYVYGLLNNYIPYRIPGLIAENLIKDEEYEAPVMLTTGIFTLPSFILYK